MRLNLKKLQTIKDWKRLITIQGIQSFLNLANFYQKFIKIFLQLAKLFLDLFKNICPSNGRKRK
jgi:hypothetical protein